MYVFFSFSTTCLPFIRTSAKNIDLDQFVISIGRKKKNMYIQDGLLKLETLNISLMFDNKQKTNSENRTVSSGRILATLFF